MFAPANGNDSLLVTFIHLLFRYFYLIIGLVLVPKKYLKIFNFFLVRLQISFIFAPAKGYSKQVQRYFGKGF